MAAVTSQLIESATHFPNGVEHPFWFVGAAVGSYCVYRLGELRFQATEEAAAVPYSNGALLEKQVLPGRKQARRDRLAPVLAEVAGLGLVAAQFLGHPTYESTITDTHANVIAVEDVSFSMAQTHDLGSATITRDQAVATALETAPYKGSLGVIQAAASAKVAVPLNKNWHSYKNELHKGLVDPNGGQIVQAMDLAGSLLQQAAAKHEGTVVVVSDGTVDDSGEAIATEAAKLEKEGIVLKAVVVGTGEGTYSLNGSKQQTPSPVQPDRFDGFGADNIVQAKTVHAVDTEMDKLIHDAGTGHQKHTWPGLGILGGLVFSAGFLKDKWQRINRIV